MADEAQKRRFLNDCGFSEEILLDREITVKKLEEEYPDIPSYYLQIAYNHWRLTPLDKQNEEIAAKTMEQKSTRPAINPIQKNNITVTKSSESIELTKLTESIESID